MLALGKHSGHWTSDICAQKSNEESCFNLAWPLPTFSYAIFLEFDYRGDWPNLLETLKVVPQLHVKSVGHHLWVATILVIFLSVQEPVWDLELSGVSDDNHQVLQLSCGQLASPNIHLTASDENENRVPLNKNNQLRQVTCTNEVPKKLATVGSYSSNPHLLLMSTSAFLQTKLAKRRPTPLMEVKANMIFWRPSTFVFRTRRMCWKSSFAMSDCIYKNAHKTTNPCQITKP